MIFIKNGKDYPRHIGDIQIDFPSWKEGDTLPVGWSLVKEVAPLQYTATHKVIERFPKFENGVWTQQWEVLPITDADRTMYDTVDPGQIEPQNPEL